ncbi:hypothetical protein JAAARDRAFT_243319 [Jaapia argillacea MUCL 33604]|uniref:Uncharacterized protein n=1 Tax=Jaapia argillacea MUCL 33604 TaxID=933084 RepID=A0A067QFM9_9AGAM|nr:hypothetical protein JAAARDRAFT_243319 [Jaapia argillacea MUCL 33604]
MAVLKELSIVPDSTISSSSPPPPSSSYMPTTNMHITTHEDQDQDTEPLILPPITKRVVKTYGKSREANTEFDPDTSSTTLIEEPTSSARSATGFKSRRRSYSTARGASHEGERGDEMEMEVDEVPGTPSDSEQAFDASQETRVGDDMEVEKKATTIASASSPSDDEDEEEAPFQFSWQKKLQNWTAEDDERYKPRDEPDEPPSRSPLHSPARAPSIHLPKDASIPSSPPELPPTTQSPPRTQPTPSQPDDFGSSLTELRSSPIPRTTDADTFDLILAGERDPSPAPRRRQGKKRVGVVHDSDSEDDAGRGSPVNASRSSPVHEAASDEEMEAEPFVSRLSKPKSNDGEQPKDKGKSKVSRRTVPPLQFKADADLSGSGSGTSKAKKLKGKIREKESEKRTKTKPPTKKQKNELSLMKEQMIAEKEVHVPKAAPTNKYTLTSLLKGVKESVVPPQKSASFTVPPSDDPIQDFTSPPRHVDARSSTKVEARMDDDMGFGAPMGLVAPSSPPAFKLPAVKDMGQASGSKERATTYRSASESEGDDEELPDISEVLEVESRKKEEERKIRELREMKLKVLEKQQQQAGSSSRLTKQHVWEDDDDDDDDLVVVDEAGDEEEKRKERAKGLKVPEGKKKKRYSFPTVPVHKQRTNVEGRDGARGKGKAVVESQEMLTKRLLQDHARKAAEEKRKKEEDWVRRGGVVKENGVGVGAGGGLEEWVEKGLEVARRREEGLGEEDGEGSGSDGEWRPEEGSGEEAEGEDEREKDNEDVLMGSQRTEEGGDGFDEDMGMDMGADTQIDENENHQPKAPRRVVRPLTIVDSDDEQDTENKHPTGRVLVPDTSFSLPQASPPFPHDDDVDHEDQDEVQIPSLFAGHRSRASLSSSSFGEGTDNETDKENEGKWMFDRSEDKENKVVVRHGVGIGDGVGARPAMPPRLSSLQGLEEGVKRCLSMVFVDEEEANGGLRKPFGQILEGGVGDDDEDPFAFNAPPFAVRSTQASRLGSPMAIGFSSSPRVSRVPQPSFEASPPPLQFGLKGGDDVGFSQFTDDGEGVAPELGIDGEDENDENAPKAVALQPAFSQFFEPSAKPVAGPSCLSPLQARGSDLFSQQPGGGLDRLRKGFEDDDIPLTLDVRLQPALEVSDSRRRAADAIFEKEQEFVLLDAQRKPEKKKEELYVNEYGFLTQTRPEASTPQIYRVISPSQTTTLLNTHSVPRNSIIHTQSSSRKPLRTLSETDVFETDDSQPRRRIRKRSVSPLGDDGDLGGGYRSSPSPSPSKRPRDAFTALRRGAERVKSKKEKLQRSEFVEAEAEESDEDAMFGFGGKKKNNDEESGGEDEDKVVEGLVDDGQVEERVDLVMEKVK